jgi:hypothetical protein
MAKGWLIGGAAFLGVLLIAAIIVVLTSKPQPLTPGTPEAAVQEFLLALTEEDFPTAHAYLSDELKEACPLESFGGSDYPRYNIENNRIALGESTITDDIAFVSIDVTYVSNDWPFGSSEYTNTERYSLKRIDGEWQFVSSPWPYYGCGPLRPTEPITIVTPTPEP